MKLDNFVGMMTGHFGDLSWQSDIARCSRIHPVVA